MDNASPIRIIDLQDGKSKELSSRDSFAIALGNFDGVHCAHRALLAATVRRARVQNLRNAVLCFDPPSSDFLSNSPIEHLSTTKEKLALFAECGIEYAYLANFPSLRQMTPMNFIEQILKDACRAQAVVCGFNFRFGHGGIGNTVFLIEQFGKDAVEIIPPHCTSLCGQETVISSSVIRAALTSGDVQTAAKLLGQPYRMCATVTHGKRLGHKIGSPTINQYPPRGKLLPAPGVYITRAHIDGAWIGGVSNVGVRPTVEQGVRANCETHLLDFDQNIYDRAVTIEFLERRRDEQRFSTLDELRDAILSDIAYAKSYFNH